MLATLALIILNIPGVRAQTGQTAISASNSEYYFSTGAEAGSCNEIWDGSSYNSGGEPVPTLTMDCLAANGYGQWTLSSTTNGSYNYGWYLLENSLRVPSTKYVSPATTFPGCIPPGVVTHGSLTSVGSAPADPKVTANLDGMVNFVWPDPTGTPSRRQFVIQWLGNSDLNIGMSGFGPATSDFLVSGTTIHKTTVLCNSSGATTHAVVSVSPFQDEFDVASDAAYLYITWSSTENTTAGAASEVWALVVDLSSHAVVGTGAIDMGAGIRPTIACDPRNNRTGTHVPKFDVAYVTAATLGSIVWQNVTITSMITITPYTISASKVMNPSGGGDLTYTSPSHVRALVSSAAGCSCWDPALYAIVLINTPALIMFNPTNTNITAPKAAYVDGDQLNHATAWGTTPRPATGRTWASGGAFPVVDEPIVAFANPYDNQTSWHIYDQFHCVYQVAGKDDLNNPHNPLLIVRGSDGTGHPLDPDASSTDTKLIINQAGNVLMNDPSKYVGAVNQMGIFVHWRASYTNSGTTADAHFYARDLMRTFDEDIDENTLVTASCYVTKGTGHGGTTGAKLLASKYMTVWTDPGYGYLSGSSNANQGLYQRQPYAGLSNVILTPPGTLNFNVPSWLSGLSPTSVLLTIGEGSGKAGATLSVVPNFQFLFDLDASSPTESTQGVTIEAGSTFNYYGLNHTTSTAPAVTPVPEITGSGTPVTGGGNINLTGVSGTLANLIVYPGSDFHIMEASNFTSTYGYINVLNSSTNIDPYSTTTPVSGICTFEGIANIDHSTIKGNFPAYGSPVAHNYVMRVVAPSAINTPLSADQFVSSHNTYTNTAISGVGLSEIRFDGVFTSGGTIGYGNCSFDNDNLTDFEITGVDPQNSFTVTNSTFGGTQESAIDLEELSYTTYGTIDIADNTFNDGGYSMLTGVLLYNFHQQDASYVTVEDNILAASSSHPGGNPIGIDFEATLGSIVGNTLSTDFNIGIKVVGTSTFSNQTFICSNDISGSLADGLSTDWYQGYIKLNQIHGNQVGHLHADIDLARLVATNIYSNSGVGISSSGNIDLSGVHHNGHHPGTGDIAGYNSVHGNSGDEQILLTSSSILLYLYQDETPSNWTAAGLNNIYKDGGATLLIEGDGNTTSVDIGNNYWGGHDPQTPNTMYWNNFHYSASVAASSQSSSSGIVCSDGFSTKKGNDLPTSVLSMDTCEIASNAVALCQQWSSFGNFDVAYDTVHWAINHCAHGLIPGNALGGVTSSAGHAKALSTQVGRDSYKSWILDTVLQLRSDDEWFCDGVECLTPAFIVNGQDDIPADLAIFQFLIENPRCAQDSINLRGNYVNLRKNQIHAWQDTAKNNDLKYFDSTLPSFHLLGLDTLLNFASVAHYSASGSQIIMDAHLLQNPFKIDASLSVSTAREAYLHIAVLDLLGRTVDHAGYDGVFEPGSRTVLLKMESLPSGTYYIRISTANNELRTLKMVKDK